MGISSEDKLLRVTHVTCEMNPARRWQTASLGGYEPLSCGRQHSPASSHHLQTSPPAPPSPRLCPSVLMAGLATTSPAGRMPKIAAGSLAKQPNKNKVPAVWGDWDEE